MRVGGGLHYVDGPQGHGKSFFAVRQIHDALRERRYVATNIPLLPGWAERIALHDPLGLAMRGYKRRVSTLRGLYLYAPELGDVLRFNLPGRGEGRGLLVWDESHNDLGNRTWQEDGRETLIKGATQLRKLGWTAFLVTQHQDNTDAALRRVAGWRVRMTNVRERIRLLGLRVLPRPFFIAAFYPANAALMPGSRPEFTRRYLLSWHRRLYDTYGIYSGLYEDLLPLGERVELPPAGSRTTDPTGCWWEAYDELVLNGENPGQASGALLPINPTVTGDGEHRAA